MRWLLVALVLIVSAGCVDPGNDDVSLEGPSVTTAKDRTTTTGESTTTERATTTTAAPVPIEVGRWVGAATTDTENITVKESWELHWKVPSGQFGPGHISIEWTVPGKAYPSDNRSISTEEGSSLIREGGTFYLTITSYGSDYEVWAVDIPS